MIGNSAACELGLKSQTVGSSKFVYSFYEGL